MKELQNIVMLKTENIFFDSMYQSRQEHLSRFFDLVEKLSISISKVGLINPLVIYNDGKKDYVVSGFLRLQAYKHLASDVSNKNALSYLEIPCYVIDKARKLDVKYISYVENEHRLALNGFEVSSFFLSEIESLGTRAKVIDKYSISKTYLSKCTKINTIVPNIQQDLCDYDLDSSIDFLYSFAFLKVKDMEILLELHGSELTFLIVENYKKKVIKSKSTKEQTEIANLSSDNNISVSGIFTPNIDLLMDLGNKILNDVDSSLVYKFKLSATLDKGVVDGKKET